MVEENRELLRQKRMIVVADRIEPATADMVSAELLLLNLRDDPEIPINMLIRSEGGDSWAALDIFDAVSHSYAPVHGIVVGMAYSAASILLQGCKYSGGGIGKRLLYPNARILIHHGTNLIRINPEKFEEDLEDAKKLETRVVEIYVKATCKSRQEIEAQMRKERKFWAEEAIAFGLADGIT